MRIKGMAIMGESASAPNPFLALQSSVVPKALGCETPLESSDAEPCDRGVAGLFTHGRVSQAASVQMVHNPSTKVAGLARGDVRKGQNLVTATPWPEW